MLVSGDATPILEAAVAATGSGGELVGWSPTQVTHRPRGRTVVQYRAEVSWSGRPAAPERFVATTGGRLPDAPATVDVGGTRVAVWRWPWDPELPALAAALDPAGVATLLDELGIGGGAVEVRARAYRPTRRAVVEVTGRRRRLFLKVVRPDRAERLHRLHRHLAASAPVPESLGHGSDGIVVLAGLPGETLRASLRSARDEALPPAAIDSLLDSLGDSLPDSLPDSPDDRPASQGRDPRRGDLAGSVEHYASVVASTMPSLRAELDDVVAAIAGGVADGHEMVAVHGDLHAAQLLVERGRIVGLVDVDTAGRGHRIDEWANLCAHLSVLARSGAGSSAADRYCTAVVAHVEERFDRSDFRARVAAGVVGLATGPFRVLEADWPAATRQRVALARAWLTR